jgi:hypothetical protein
MIPAPRAPMNFVSIGAFDCTVSGDTMAPLCAELHDARLDIAARLAAL